MCDFIATFAAFSGMRGLTEGSSFYFNHPFMIDKNVVRSLVEEWLKDKEYFLVDVEISPDDKIVVEIDHADGVWIEDCVQLSRYIEERLSRDEEDYELEVGSAGLGQPFKVEQQYVNYVGKEVEVLDARTCQRIGQVDIPNCRYITFDKGYAYVSSYVGPVGLDPNAQLGAVFQVDTATLEITAEVTVGYQPDELVVQDGLLYVANSGGYRKPDYDYTVSVVDVATMTQIRKIPVGINLHRIRADRYGKLWVSSRGDERSIPSRLFVLEKDKRTGRMEVSDTLDIPCSEMEICGDSLYLCSVAWSDVSQENSVTYGIVDVRTGELVSNSFIQDGTDVEIEIPYGLKVNPENGDIYVTDAKNYVSSGNLHCYGRDGKRKWSVRTGDIPARMVLLNKKK